jgi:hypothetical protein
VEDLKSRIKKACDCNFLHDVEWFFHDETEHHSKQEKKKCKLCKIKNIPFKSAIKKTILFTILILVFSTIFYQSLIFYEDYKVTEKTIHSLRTENKKYKINLLKYKNGECKEYYDSNK